MFFVYSGSHAVTLIAGSLMATPHLQGRCFYHKYAKYKCLYIALHYITLIGWHSIIHWMTGVTLV